MDAKEIDKRKIEVLKEAAFQLNSEMLKLTNIREDIHRINKEKWTESINKIKDDLGAKQSMLFIGPFSSGKSSFINAILGEAILPTNDRPCTSVVTELRFKNDGTGHEGKAVKKDGSQSETVYNFDDLVKMIDGPTGAIGQSAAYHHIELKYDISQLKEENENLKILCAAGVTIIDCPGYESPYACSEDIIDEYISRATHTFWMNPVDQFGGSFEINKIKAIRQKTTTLIPVFTKADLKPDEDERDELRELYSNTLGGLFRQKEPIFTSAKKWHEGVELAKKDGDTKSVDKLFLESGIHQFLAAMVDATGSKEVTEAKVSSCRMQIDEIIQNLGQTAEREQSYWKGKLEEIGWNEKRNVALNDIKREADEWIKNEAERVGSKVNAHLEDEIVSYICNAGEKVSIEELQKKVSEVWKDEIDANRKAWGKELSRIYEERMKSFKFDDDSSFVVPDWLNGETIDQQMKAIFADLLTTVQRGGLQTTVMGVAGGLLLAMAASIKDVAVVGGALSAVFAAAGPVLIAVAAAGAIPVFMRVHNESKERVRKEVTNNVENWLQKVDMTTSVKTLLMAVNDDTFAKLSAESDKTASEYLRNYNTCENVARKLNEVHSNIVQQFAA